MQTITASLKTILFTAILLVNLLFGQAAWADPGRFINSPDYQEITTKIDELLQTQANPATRLNAPDLNQKLANLQTLKYILETAQDRASCTNATGQILGVYLKSKKSTADEAPSLYYLGDGKATDDDFSCMGVYLPAGTNVAFSLGEPGNALAEPTLLRIVEGTQLTLTTNPDNAVLELNVPPAEILTAATSSWNLPALSLDEMNAQVANAPID